MPRYTFPGYPVFLERAAREVGCPEAETPARKISTLSSLANLCAQAADAEPSRVPAILKKAGEFRDQLHAAHRAAELMLSEVGSALVVAEPPVIPSAAGRPVADRKPRGKPGRGPAEGRTPEPSEGATA